MQQEDSNSCPANITLALLGRPATLSIIRSLLAGARRFNEIARAVGCSPNTLRDRLRDLESQGVVSRTVVSAMPPNVEYELTAKGRELEPVFDALDRWGRKWPAMPKSDG
jgi:DNA-binding HxlR family transcriptional regulator